MPKLGSQDLQGFFCDVCGFEHSMSEVENFLLSELSYRPKGKTRVSCTGGGVARRDIPDGQCLTVPWPLGQ